MACKKKFGGKSSPTNNPKKGNKIAEIPSERVTMLFRQSRFSLIHVLSAGLFLVILLSLTTGGFAAEGRFSIRISGGLGYLSLAEMNNGIRGVMNDIW